MGVKSSPNTKPGFLRSKNHISPTQSKFYHSVCKSDLNLDYIYNSHSKSMLTPALPYLI